jgi:hypothetical protein
LLIAVFGSLQATVSCCSDPADLHCSHLIFAIVVSTAVLRLHFAASSDHIFLFIVNLIVNFFTIEGVFYVLLLIAVILFDTLNTAQLTR